MNNPEIDIDGSKFWKNDKGKYHKLNGPAIEYHNGNKSWYVNGSLHRLDGPAIEWYYRYKQWRILYQKINTINNLLDMLMVKL